MNTGKRTAHTTLREFAVPGGAIIKRTVSYWAAIIRHDRHGSFRLLYLSVLLPSDKPGHRAVIILDLLWNACPRPFFLQASHKDPMIFIV